MAWFSPEMQINPAKAFLPDIRVQFRAWFCYEDIARTEEILGKNAPDTIGTARLLIAYEKEVCIRFLSRVEEPLVR
jgi:hypothetical protein